MPTTRGLVSFFLAGVAVQTLAACSPGGGGQSPFGDPGSGGQATVQIGGAAGVLNAAGGGSSQDGTGGSTLVIGTAGSSATGMRPDASCAALPFSAEHVVTTKQIPKTVTTTQPVDLFVMFDQSLSMTCAIASGGDRWDAVKSALQGFVQSPMTAGISVGIQYFGQGGLASSCNAADYQTPDVEIGPLPANATPIVNSLNAHKPSTNTPTAAALGGAINHALVWAAQHPADVVVVVLVTDGQPNACGTVSDCAKVAQDGNGKGVRTFVVGVTSPGNTCNLDPNPPNQTDLDAVATGGGTMKALIVDTSTNPIQQFIDELNQIRKTVTNTTTTTVTEVQTTKVACEYKLPAPPQGETFDPTKVDIQFTGTSGAKELVYQVSSPADCTKTTSLAWYYDNPSSPTQILLCPQSCKVIQAATGDGGAVAMGAPDPRVDVLLGCKTHIATVR